MNEFFIIIPCFNPTKKIESIINKLHRKFEGNIILIDDGNTTKNKKYLQSIANKNIRVKLLNHAVNLGKGAAIKTALNYILTNFKKFKACITVDADGQHDFSDIFSIFEHTKKLQKNKKCLVLGCRNITKKNPFKSYIGNLVSNKIFSYLLNFKFHDTQTGLRGFNRRFALMSFKIENNKFDFETEQLILARKHGARINQYPIQTIYFDKNNKTTFDPLIDSFKIYFLILKQLLISIFFSIFDFIIFYKTINEDNIIEANLIARSIILSFHFFLLKNFVYNSSNGFLRLFLFYLIFVYLIGFISSLTQIYLSSVYGVDRNLSKIIIESLLFFINFSFIKTIIFKK